MADTAGKTIMIVDDEEDVRRFMKMVLQDEGFNVVTANDGKEALALMDEIVPDLISLDVVMPGGSGVKFHRGLRQKPEWARIPVLVVTGHARDELGQTDFNEMTMSGPGVYLEKPVTAESYLQAVRKILGLSGSGQEMSDTSGLRDEAKALLDSTDSETLQEILKVMKSRKK